MWKSKEEYLFDMPGSRIDDVYGKNARLPLWPYIKIHNPKVTKIFFDARSPGLHVEIGIPKYPKEYPYFTPEDTNKLLKTYMDYANMSHDELAEWYKQQPRKPVKNSKNETD